KRLIGRNNFHMVAKKGPAKTLYRLFHFRLVKEPRHNSMYRLNPYFVQLIEQNSYITKTDNPLGCMEQRSKIDTINDARGAISSPCTGYRLYIRIIYHVLQCRLSHFIFPCKLTTHLIQII